MNRRDCLAGAAMGLSLTGWASGEQQAASDSASAAPLPARLVIGHRGASALRPEHTLQAYARAIDDGADAIEPDLVITRDGVLVARHENELSSTTNVASKPEFAARRMTRLIGHVSTTGWFTEDFTLAELQTLRARERIALNRPANTAYNDQFAIPAFQAVMDLVRAKTRETGRTIAIYPETKHPAYFRSIRLPLEQRLADALDANGYRGASAPVFIQSFETASLQALRELTGVRLVQLLSGHASAAGLREIARHADGIGPDKSLVIPRDARNRLGMPTTLVADAHAAGLFVHPWTFRPENPFLPAGLRQGDSASPSERGDMAAEITAFLRTGIDGFFTDDPAAGRAALDAFARR